VANSLCLKAGSFAKRTPLPRDVDGLDNAYLPLLLASGAFARDGEQRVFEPSYRCGTSSSSIAVRCIPRGDAISGQRPFYRRLLG
jgi:hypothetical protein